MTAEALPIDSDGGTLPRWFYPPPPDGWRAEDLDRLPPEAPRHIELIDGALVVMSPQAPFHMRVINSLVFGLAPQVPEDWEVAREMTILLGDRQRPEPDVLVVDEAALDTGRTWLSPDQVHLVIEVVSPESEARDTLRKPQLYAEAGIRHFWRIENDNGRAVVFTHELDIVGTSRTYFPTGIYRDTMKLTAPFPIELDVAALPQRLKRS